MGVDTWVNKYRLLGFLVLKVETKSGESLYLITPRDNEGSADLYNEKGKILNTKIGFDSEADYNFAYAPIVSKCLILLVLSKDELNDAQLECLKESNTVEVIAIVDWKLPKGWGRVSKYYGETTLQYRIVGNIVVYESQSNIIKDNGKIIDTHLRYILDYKSGKILKQINIDDDYGKGQITCNARYVFYDAIDTPTLTVWDGTGAQIFHEEGFDIENNTEMLPFIHPDYQSLITFISQDEKEQTWSSDGVIYHRLEKGANSAGELQNNLLDEEGMLEEDPDYFGYNEYDSTSSEWDTDY